MLGTTDVSKAIDTYLNRSNTQYAVMVNGAWGIGKTHFIQHDFAGTNNDVQLIYLSLYGLSTIDDIENELLKTLTIGTAGSPSTMNGHRPAMSDDSDGIRIGGIGYLVKYLLAAQQKASSKKQRVLTICFDDLERWKGDLNVCLAYINRLVEHESIKCILIGNTDEFSCDQSMAFANAREKTVRYLYRLEIDQRAVFKIALEQINFGSNASRRFMRALINNNFSSLETVMSRIKNSNIRIAIEALQLFEYIYRSNPKVFNASKSLAFTYWVSLWSALVLLRKYFTSRELKDEFLGTDHTRTMGYAFLNKIGYFASEPPEQITEESKLLLDIVFYRLDKISLKGLFSMIDNGFYIKQHFAGDFDKWGNGELFDTYLDPIQFYQLDDERAATIIDQVEGMLFKSRSVTNPATILLLIERMINDVDNGVIRRDPDQYRKQMLEAINYLYNQKKMDFSEIEFFDSSDSRFQKCRGIYNYIKQLNGEYLHSARTSRLTVFWQKLMANPEQLEILLEEYGSCNIFFHYQQPQDIIECLEVLSNAQLFHLSEMITGDSIDRHRDGMSNDERVKSTLVAQQLEEKYAGVEGLHASHLRQVAGLIISE